MKIRLKFMGAIIALLLISGCSRKDTIYNIPKSPIGEEKIGSGIYSDVYRAIKRAGASVNWVIRKTKEGEAIGRFQSRNHVAMVKIIYNNEYYSINYLESQNLNYDAENGTIHKNYNVWVHRLEKAINSNLSLLNKK